MRVAVDQLYVNAHRLISNQIVVHILEVKQNFEMH